MDAKYDCQSCGQCIDCTCNYTVGMCVACSSHVCTVLKDDTDITSREYLRRRIWSDAFLAGGAEGLLLEAERWASVALDAYDKKFRDGEAKP